MGYMSGTDTMCYDFEQNICLQVKQLAINLFFFSFRTSPCKIYYVFTTCLYSSNAYNLGISLWGILLWENISGINMDTAKLKHSSIIGRDFPEHSVICRLAVAFHAIWIAFGMSEDTQNVTQECLKHSNIPCRTTRCFQDLLRSGGGALSQSISPCTSIVAFCCFQQGNMNLCKFDFCLVGAELVLDLMWTPPADHVFLL